MEEIKELKKLMEEDRPVSWDSLPDIDLYMDQVVYYLSRQSTGGKEPAITSAMVNNYVKDGLLPRANGKRYNREHIAYLTIISLLKNVLTVKDMKLLLSHTDREHPETFYDSFLEYVDGSFKGINDAIDENMDSESLFQAAMILALASCASKTACEHLLSIIRSQQDEPDPKAKKKEEKEAAKLAKEKENAEKAKKSE